MLQTHAERMTTKVEQPLFKVTKVPIKAVISLDYTEGDGSSLLQPFTFYDILVLDFKL